MMRCNMLCFLLIGLMLPATAQAQFIDFDDFLDQVMAQPTITQMDSVINVFIESVENDGGFPYIEGDNAHFIYYNTANSVHVAGDFNGWNPNVGALTRLQPTYLYYSIHTFEMDARLDYKFVLNGGNWILDPLNPHTVPGGFGNNSELAMPDYVQPPEIEYYPEYQHGTVTNHSIYSDVMNQAYSYFVYLPPNYDESGAHHFPVMYLFDGQEYRNFASIQYTADYLINNGLMVDAILVMQIPRNRNVEYWLNDDFVEFIADELVPEIDNTYHTIDSPEARAVSGVSLGGLTSTYMCLQRADLFGLCAAQSPAYWVDDTQIFDMMNSIGFDPDVKVYMDWGTYEPSIQGPAIVARDWFMANGNAVIANEYHEGHSWGQWRAHIDDGLMFLFDGITAIADEEELNRFTPTPVLQNYPNPFSNVTTIRYNLPTPQRLNISLYNSAGQKVKTLLDGHREAGSHTFQAPLFDMAPGVYFYQLKSETLNLQQKMIILR